MSIPAALKPRRSFRLVVRHLIVTVLFYALADVSALASQVPDCQGLKPILNYISSAWDTPSRFFQLVLR